MEIERKFLLTKEQYEKYSNNPFKIETIYLSVNPEVRIRKCTKITYQKYLLTIKGDGSISRPEINKSLTKKEYEELLLIPNVGICIKYWNKIGSLEFSKFIFPDNYEFYQAEVEFSDESSANEFTPIFEYEEEVTNNNEYKIKNIMKNHQL